MDRGKAFPRGFGYGCAGILASPIRLTETVKPRIVVTHLGRDASFTPMPSQLLARILLASYWLSFFALARHAPYPSEMALQHVPTVAFGLWLSWRTWKRPLDLFTMILVVAFAGLHMVAARWIYSYVPYDAWCLKLFDWSPQIAFGWTRNHFDRLVHFCYGLLLFRPFRLSWGRFARSEPASRMIAWEFILASSMLYELFEWGLTLLMSPGDAENYNGQQGDPFDSQKDMAMAALGGLIAWGIAWLGALRRPSRTGRPGP
jgi:putative membrane protein